MCEIVFCWGLKTPVDIYVNGEIKTLKSHTLKLKSSSGSDALKQLKGTNTKILSMINVIKCTQ